MSTTTSTSEMKLPEDQKLTTRPGDVQPWLDRMTTLLCASIELNEAGKELSKGVQVSTANMQSAQIRKLDQQRLAVKQIAYNNMSMASRILVFGETHDIGDIQDVTLSTIRAKILSTHSPTPAETGRLVDRIDDEIQAIKQGAEESIDELYARIVVLFGKRDKLAHSPADNPTKVKAFLRAVHPERFYYVLDEFDRKKTHESTLAEARAIFSAEEHDPSALQRKHNESAAGMTSAAAHGVAHRVGWRSSSRC